MAPPIPARLANRPLTGGLVVPWIAVSDGVSSHALGAVHRKRVVQCLELRLCQLDGEPLGDRFVALVLKSELDRRWSREPALHPECAAYSQLACPMVAGTMQRYRAGVDTSRVRCNLPGCDCAGWVTAPREHQTTPQPAQPWFALFLRGYDVCVDQSGDVVGLGWQNTPPLRVRPVASGCPVGA